MIQTKQMIAYILASIKAMTSCGREKNPGQIRQGKEDHVPTIYMVLVQSHEIRFLTQYGNVRLTETQASASLTTVMY